MADVVIVKAPFIVLLGLLMPPQRFLARMFRKGKEAPAKILLSAGHCLYYKTDVMSHTCPAQSCLACAALNFSALTIAT